MKCLVPAFLLFVLANSGCRYTSQNLSETNLQSAISLNRYATGFSVRDEGSYKLLTVLNPWQNSREVSYSYVLSSQRELLPDSLQNIPWFRIPLKRVVVLSTTHVAMLVQLGEAGSIVGLSGSEFIYTPEVREGISSGRIVDVGYEQGLDYETIVELRPDALFLYGVEGNVVATLEKLSELGIPTVFCGEYLEPHPLGKAEWICFFSCFFQQEEKAADFFNRIDTSYHHLKDIAAQAQDKPSVLTGLPWKDTWHMAGGKSFAARLIEDAGGDYLWSDNTSTQAIPLDLESVYLRAVDAGVWINPGAASSLRDIGYMDERFMDLEVVRKGRVYNNNLRINREGGNDYWESGTLRPDLILADLISIFHPDLLSDHEWVYYRQLK